MPEKENFYNPYRFLLPQPPSREQKEALETWLYHERYRGVSGHAKGEILTLTPLVVGGGRQQQDDQAINNSEQPATFAHNPEDGVPLIPGSGLKGCIVYLSGLVSGDPAAPYFIFGDLELEGNKKFPPDSRRHSHQNLKGHVHFSDARLDKERSPREAHDVDQLEKVTTVLASPKERHKAFYKNRQAIKLFHHQPRVQKPQDMQRQGPISRGKRNTKVESPIKVLPANARFIFTVDFNNLNPVQCQVFLRTLFLPPGLCHKIGGAKPLGGGSVHIRPLEITLCEDKAALYRGKDATKKISDNEDCEAFLQNYCNEVSLTDDLQRMLLWRENDQRRYDYPGYDWFKKNSQKPLRPIQDVYPEDLQETYSKSIDQLTQRWQRNQELAQA